jgi:hypothetical protein
MLSTTTGPAKCATEGSALFVDMNSRALSSSPTGANQDLAFVYDRSSAISVTSLLVCRDLDGAGTQQRSRHNAATVMNGSYRKLTGVANLPALEQAELITNLISEFIIQLRSCFGPCNATTVPSLENEIKRTGFKNVTGGETPLSIVSQKVRMTRADLIDLIQRTRQMFA